jgi:hypothetical protein
MGTDEKYLLRFADSLVNADYFEDGIMKITQDCAVIVSNIIKRLITSPRKEKKMRGRKIKEIVDKKVEILEHKIRLLECKVEGMKTLNEVSTAGRKGCHEELEARVHVLEFPMGQIEHSHYESVREILLLRETASEHQYVYANKHYAIPEISSKNITAFRKKGEYVEIRWEEELGATIKGEKYSMTKYKTFLLKDELIPLDATYDFGDTKWQLI